MSGVFSAIVLQQVFPLAFWIVGTQPGMFGVFLTKGNLGYNPGGYVKPVVVPHPTFVDWGFGTSLDETHRPIHRLVRPLGSRPIHS